MMSSWWAVRSLLLTCACSAIVLSGCGESGEPTLVPVQGKITFGGGAWPNEGTLCFAPVDSAPGVPKRPASAHFDKNGNFRATSFKEGDGLIPGRYKISVDCWEVKPTMGGPRAKSYVPDKYQSVATSDMELMVTAGVPQRALVLNVPKP
jgi:hypothetical protein